MASITVHGLIGRQVVSIAEGERLGVVKDVLFDPTARTVVAFALGGESGESILAFGKVRRIGPDAVMVDQKADLQSGPTEGAKRFSEVEKLPAISVDGVNLGSVADAEFDSERSFLLTVDVRSGGVLGIGQQKAVYSIDKVKSFGTSAVTLDPGATAAGGSE